ncbi:1-phosphofructokinase [Sphingobium sp. H39-3-25]|uniref:1-phosphofructokinase n=1 Tax=Sphingobium arseniciresistens TaxID=3030834 RepID=UPI0023B935C2|nr:1-phosphofructokinase [Sphingobium arseniciresistens]
MSILTLTLNPAIDQTVTLEQLVRGAVHRASAVRFNAGGKGVNVASCLADWGADVIATGLLGADNAASFEALMAAKGIGDTFVRVTGASRTNIKLVDAQETTDINLPGFDADAGAIATVARTLKQHATPGSLMVLAGSLPGGIDPDCYAALLADLVPMGAKVLLDASGPALRAALDGPALPWAIKPNVAELAELVGHPLECITDVVAAASDLHQRGIDLVAVSMGAEGALFLNAQGAVRASLPPVTRGSTVGAGDAMVAGIAAALSEGGDLERIARLASAFAVGKLGLAGPNLPPREEIERLAAQTSVEAMSMAGETL